MKSYLNSYQLWKVSVEIFLLLFNTAAQTPCIQYSHHEGTLKQQQGPPGGPGTSCWTRDGKVMMVIDQRFSFSPQVRG